MIWIRPHNNRFRLLAAILFLMAFLGVEFGLTYHEAQHASCGNTPADQDTKCDLCAAMTFFAALSGVSPIPVILLFCGLLVLHRLQCTHLTSLLSFPVRGPPSLVLSSIF